VGGFCVDGGWELDLAWELVDGRIDNGLEFAVRCEDEDVSAEICFEIAEGRGMEDFVTDSGVRVCFTGRDGTGGGASAAGAADGNSSGCIRGVGNSLVGSQDLRLREGVGGRDVVDMGWSSGL
jgi:hypothetical protein